MQPSELTKDIGMKIKTQRILLGMSQSSLAEKIDVSFQQIQKYENAKNQISVDRLLQISKVLKVGMDYFFTKMSVNEMKYSRETLELIRNFEDIKNNSVKRSVYNLVKSLRSADIV